MKKAHQKTNPYLQLPLTVAIVKGLTKEKHIGRYLYDLLEFVGLKGPFEVQVSTRTRGSGFHHGAECKGIKYNGVRYFVQSSDNSTRYLCYLRSPEMTPTTLLQLLKEKLPNGNFNTSMAKVRPLARDAGLVDVGKELATAVVSTSSVLPKVSLAGAAEDPIVVAMILISVRLKQGLEGFTARAFHELISKEYAPGVTTYTSGQLIRRIVKQGYLSVEGMTGKKIYRFAEEGHKLLAEHDKAIAESAASALKIKGVDELSKALGELEAKARQHAAAAQRLADLNGEIEKAGKRIEQLKKEIDETVALQEELREQATAQHAIVDGPLAAARQSYEEIQVLLKAKT